MKFELKYLIPNIITAFNLFSGLISIIFILESDYITASWLIVLAAVFDVLDGAAARKFNAFCEFGREFDSFADLISFALAPSLLIYMTFKSRGHFFLILMVFTGVYFLSACLRLSRFNIRTECTAEKSDFCGMPLPTSAFLLVSYYIFNNSILNYGVKAGIILFILIFTSLSMLSQIEYYNLKSIFKKRSFLKLIILISLFFIDISLFPLVLSYIVFNNYRAVKNYLYKNRILDF